MSYWRKQAAPIIRQVIEEVGREDMRALRKALAEAYPWYEKRGHPYKIWLNEIRRQLEGRQHNRPPRPDPVAPGQTTLF